MKKIVASVGAAAIAAATTQVADASGVGSVDPSRAWSVSCALRGFYDDNYVTAPRGQERDSVGVSVSPSVALNLPLDQTTFGLRYTFGASWYSDREDLATNVDNNAWDFSHQFDAFLNHSFSERYTVDVTESFVISQEPGLMATTAGGYTYPYRTEGDNIRNFAQATLNGTLTRQLGFVIGYQNTYYDYENSGGSWDTANSLSGLLDRTEHLTLVNLRWQVQPRTVLVAGYNFGAVHYNSDEVILDPSQFPIPTGKSRNNRSHTLYGGFDQNFSKDLLLTARMGGQWLDYYHDPANDNEISPYGQVNLSYFYQRGSSINLGWTLSHNQTDLLQTDAADSSFTVDQMSSVLYTSVHHRFDAKLSGGLSASWQSSEFNGGSYDKQDDNFFDFGANLTYRFNQYFSGELGYNYSLLNSGISSRDYDRNRMYVGLIAAY